MKDSRRNQIHDQKFEFDDDDYEFLFFFSLLPLSFSFSVFVLQYLESEWLSGYTSYLNSCVAETDLFVFLWIFSKTS